jgi:hypothetical protein
MIEHLEPCSSMTVVGIPEVAAVVVPVGPDVVVIAAITYQTYQCRSTK